MTFLKKKMAVSKVAFGVLTVAIALIFEIGLPAVQALSPAPAPAPTSDGNNICFSLCLFFSHF